MFRKIDKEKVEVVRIPTQDLKAVKSVQIFRPEFVDKCWSCFDRHDCVLYLGDALVAKNICSSEELDFTKEMLKSGKISFGTRFIVDGETVIMGDLIWDGKVFRVGSYIVQDPNTLKLDAQWDGKEIAKAIEEGISGISVDRTRLLVGLRYIAVWDILNRICSDYYGCSHNEFNTISVSVRDDRGRLVYLSFNGRLAVMKDISDELRAKILADIKTLEAISPDLYSEVYHELPFQRLVLW